MEFVKRNAGFLALVLVFLVGTAVSAVLWRTANRRALEIEDKVRSQQEFMAKIRREKFGLNQRNLDLAARNRLASQRELVSFLDGLASQHGLVEESGITGLDCLRIIKEEALRMAQELEGKNIQVPTDAAFFSFGDLARSTSLPKSEEVPLILRNLRLVSEIVRVCGRSGITEFSGISRPGGLKPLVKDLYTDTPVQLTVTGSYKSIQRLVNQLQKEAKQVILVRSVELEARDQVPSGTTTAAGGGAAATPGRPGGAPAASRQPAGMPPGMMPGRMMMPGVPAAAPADDKTAGEPLPPVDKEQRLVFASAEMTAVLVLDVLDFKKPAEEK
ncbi:MAG: Amuc_1100 family pilus-like protein [Lentisphaeria bacterium]